MHERDRGDDLEVDDRLEAHPPDLAEVSGAGDPATSVAKISGAMTILIIRRKIWLNGRMFTTQSGWWMFTNQPRRTPSASPMKICCVSDRRRRRTASAINTSQELQDLETRRSDELKPDPNL